MIKECLLTNENLVRSMMVIDNNTQSKYLLSAIREAQEVGLQQIIGSKMLKKLKNLILGGTIEDDENIVYKSLVDECQMYLCYQTVTNLCLVCSVKIGNGGLEIVSDENLTPLNINDTFIVQQHYQDKADFFKKRLQQYVLNNIADLPEIEECNYNEIRAELHSAASSNIWLGGARSKGRNNKFGVNYLNK